MNGNVQCQLVRLVLWSLEPYGDYGPSRATMASMVNPSGLKAFPPNASVFRYLPIASAFPRLGFPFDVWREALRRRISCRGGKTETGSIFEEFNVD